MPLIEAPAGMHHIVIIGGGAVGLEVDRQMAASDVVVEAWIEPHWVHYAAAVVGAIFVVFTGKALAHRAEKKRTDKPAPACVKAPATRILLPVDGSEAALRAVDHIVRNCSNYRQPVEVHLINLQHAVSGKVSQFVGADEVREYHMAEGLRVPARTRQTRPGEGCVPSSHRSGRDRAADR